MNSKGLTLLETVVAMAILAVASLGIVAMLMQATRSGVAARNQVSCPRALDSAFSQLRNMDYYAITAVTSTSTTYGLTSKFPYPTTSYANIQTIVQNANFSYYVTTVTYMRRDTTDANNNGYTNDLIDFTPNPSNTLCDLYDPNICWYNNNGDSYYGTYISSTTGLRTSEAPDTHIKLVTVSIYNSKKVVVCSRSDLISLEQLTGVMDPDSEASLSLAIDTPTNNSYIYADTTTAQSNALSLSISSAYPTNIYQYRADHTVPLNIAGESEPSATINFYLNQLATITDNTTSDLSGNIAYNSSAVTSALKEGSNILHSRAVKGTFNSAWSDHSVVYDIKPPISSSATPTATSGPAGTSGLNTYNPYVSITLSDPGISTTVTSGICSSVTSLFFNGSTVPYIWTQYSSSQTVQWVTTQGIAPALSSGTVYTMGVQFGDYAGYKSSSTWTFTLSVPSVDSSSPTITNETPSGSGAGTLPLIEAEVYDSQSGINPSSISMTLNGSSVCNGSQYWSLKKCFNAGTGYIYYTPTSALSTGTTYTVAVAVSDWAGNTSNATWTFSP